jgi:hypothetical protein
MTEFYTNAVKELKNIYDNLNRKYYDNELPEVVITIQSSPKGKAYGWFAPDRWGIQADEEQVFHEINVSAEHLSRPLANLCATVNHEMVHLYCRINDIKDTSNGNVYHNKRFKEEAEKRDLIIEKAQTIGWSVTTPTEQFIEYVQSLNINEDNFKFFRKIPMGKGKETKKTTKKTTKYTCPCCEISVRGEEGLEIECKKCGVIMESKH